MSQITSVLQDIPYSKILAGVGLAALIALFRWRAGSIRGVLERIWRLAVGNTKVKDKELKKLLQEELDLEKFRFMHGIRIERMKDFHRFKKWLDKNEFALTRVLRAKRWININAPDFITKPPRAYFKSRGRSVLASLALLVVTPAMILPNASLFIGNTSKVTFVMDAKSIQHLWYGWKIDLTACDGEHAAIVSQTKLAPAEVESICGDFKSNQLQGLVSSAIRDQRGLGIGLETCWLIAMFLLVLRLAAAEEADKLHSELKSVRDEIAPADGTTNMPTHAELATK